MSEARQYPDQSGLIQIETKRRQRNTDPEVASAANRDRAGWQPQSPPSGVTPAWWETPDRTD